MGARLLITLAVTGLCALSGCANLETVWRNEDSAGRTVSVDATQRVIVSSTTVTKDGKSFPRYCAEPSPDAIASFAASMGLGASLPARGATADVNFQNALASQVGSIGLRTPTTQVIRDLITAACFAHMNGAFEDPKFAAAFERNQDFVLAAHAIAVIGGESMARQIVLSSNAATGSPDAHDAYQDYAKAQAARIQAEEDAADAAAKEEKANADLAAAEKALQDANGATPKVPADVQKAQEKRDAAKKASEDASSAKTAADKAVIDAKQREKLAQRASDAASIGQAAAGGSGSDVTPISRFSPAQHLDKHSVDGIVKIVNTTLTTGFSLERCLGQLTQVTMMSGLPEDQRQALISNIMSLCTTKAATLQTLVDKQMKEMAR